MLLESFHKAQQAEKACYDIDDPGCLLMMKGQAPVYNLVATINSSESVDF